MTDEILAAAEEQSWNFVATVKQQTEFFLHQHITMWCYLAYGAVRILLQQSSLNFYDSHEPTIVIIQRLKQSNVEDIYSSYTV